MELPAPISKDKCLAMPIFLPSHTDSNNVAVLTNTISSVARRPRVLTSAKLSLNPNKIMARRSTFLEHNFTPSRRTRRTPKKFFISMPSKMAKMTGLKLKRLNKGDSANKNAAHATATHKITPRKYFCIYFLSNIKIAGAKTAPGFIYKLYQF